MNNSSISWQLGPTTAPLPPLASLPRQSIAGNASPEQIMSFFVKNYQLVGPIFRYTHGGSSYTTLAGPSANIFLSREGREVLRAGDYRREQNQELAVRQTLVSMDGAEHASARKLQSRGYSRATIESKYDRLVQAIVAIVDKWLPGQRIQVKDVMPRIIAEQLGIGLLNYPVGDYLHDILLFVRTVVTETVAKTRAKKVLQTTAYLAAKARALELADQVIAAHRHGAAPQREPDLVDDLLAASVIDPTLFSPQELRLAVLGGYIGGLDTVAYTCTFMLYALLKHPDALQRIRSDVDRAFADGPMTTGKLRGMTALHHATLETLRLYPVAGVIQGTAAMPFEFAGHRVDEGESLIIATTVPHFLPEYYPDPDRFDLDRFSAPRYEHRQAGVFAPYGIGAHVCLGSSVAEVLIMLTIATILNQVELGMDPLDYQLRIHFTPTPVPKDFYLRVVAKRHRTSASRIVESTR